MSRRERSLVARAGMAGLLFVGVACGGASSSGVLEGTTPGEVVEAPAPSVEAYSTENRPGPVIAAQHADAIAKSTIEAASERGIEMQGDGRLALLAAWTAEQLGDGGAPPDHAITQFYAHHLGLVEPIPNLLILGHSDPATIEASVADSVGQFLDRRAYNRFGAVVVERQGLTLVVMALSTRWMELAPIARGQETGKPISVKGKLLPDFQKPVLVVARPDGSVTRVPAGPGPSFDLTVPTDEPGVYKLELLADGPHGDSVVANFPVYVGVDVPEAITLDAGGESAEGNAIEVKRVLFDLVNQSRERAGRKRLALHPGLGKVAEAHSRDMVDNEFVGHTSPTTGTAAARIERAGFKSGLILENIGRGYSARGIHRGLLESPAHRANILNPDVTHIGIGVVTEEEEGGRLAFMVTEVFVRMVAGINVEEANEALFAMINRARQARGAAPLEREKNLEAAAQKAARAYFQRPEASQQDIVDDASASLRRFSIAFSQVGGLMAVVSDIEEASRLEPTFDPDVKYIGIGIAQGERPDTQPNAIGVVIMLAWPR